MINNNFLHLIKAAINYPSYIGNAVQETFVDSAGNSVDVGVRMPTANDAADYALIDRGFDTDKMTMKLFTQALSNITPATYSPTGALNAGLEYSLKNFNAAMNDGKMEITYSFDVTYTGNNVHGVEFAAFGLFKNSYNFTYDSSYGDWSPHKNTYDIALSVCNLPEIITIYTGETYNIVVREILNANV